MIVAASPLHRSRLLRRGSVAAIGVAIAGAVSVATLSNPWLARTVGDGISDGLHRVQTVAARLAERSPGERPEGALANLKPKRAVHERALPKIRGPLAPPTAYEALVAPPLIPPVAPPPEAPLFATVAGGPPIAIPPIGGTPGSSGGPPFLSNIPLPGGGGGGIFSPPTTAAAPDVPPTPVDSVPEPASWVSMLLGLGFIAWALRRRESAVPQPASD